MSLRLGNAPVLGLALLMLAAPAAAAEPPVERSRPVTMTRWVKVFHGLEYDLVDALRSGERARLDELLAEDFEERRGDAPALPLPRADWLARSPLRAPGGVLISDMAVHERGELALVSFRLRLQGSGAVWFVVDAWRRKGQDDRFELLTRYSSELSGPSSTPGRATSPPAPPDGRR